MKLIVTFLSLILISGISALIAENEEEKKLEKFAEAINLQPLPCEEGIPCGNEAVCRRNCAAYGEQPTIGLCKGDCMCCLTGNTTNTGCTFNGKEYKSGERVEGYCVDLICRAGQFYSDGYIDECCKRCNVKDDPHFLSYDGLAYDFHGICNYSITQEGVSYNPEFGVFGDFRAYGSWVSCVDETTFKDNEHTVITMTYAGKETVSVNGEPYTVTTSIEPVASAGVLHPVLGWRVGDCIRFLGTQRLMVEYCWTGYWRQVYLYAHPALTDTLYGLCGHFNYYKADDLTHRDYFVSYPTYLPVAFGDSWKTNSQADTTCIDIEPSSTAGTDWPSSVSSVSDGPANPVSGRPVFPVASGPRLPIKSPVKRQTSDDACMEIAFDECYNVLSSVEYDGQFATEEQLMIHSRFCAVDLCAFGNDTNVDLPGYFKAIRDMLRTTLMHDVMSTPGARPPKEGTCKPCNSTCGDGGNCRYECDSTEEEAAGDCSGQACKCCKKKPTCEDSTCGVGGTCRSCSCLDDEELIPGQCPLSGCLCCRKIPECGQRCGRRGRYRCKPTSKCTRKIKGKCNTPGCTCCRKWRK